MQSSWGSAARAQNRAHLFFGSQDSSTFSLRDFLTQQQIYVGAAELPGKVVHGGRHRERSASVSRL